MPKLINKSKQFLFKNKFEVVRKTKIELLKESLLLFSFATFLILINYFIPQKIQLISSFGRNLSLLIENLVEILTNLFAISKALFIISSLIISLILLIGVINRLLKILFRKRRKIRSNLFK